MKTWFKALMCIALSFMVVFISVGYAALTDNFTIVGMSTAHEPEGVYIQKVELYSSTVSSQSASVMLPTNVGAALYGSNGKSVTYKITVKNNTAYKYAYSGLVFDTTLREYNGNRYINQSGGITVTTKDNPSDKSGTFNASDSIGSGETRVFYSTYTIGRKVANANLTTLINYKFGVHIDSAGALALDSALVKFGEILNDTDGGYATLIDKIDDKYDGLDWKANYIGNVTDSSSVDTTTIKSLFEDKLQLTINGVETNVTVLIKREDVDGDPNTGDSYTAKYGNYSTSASGCEMTIYLTTDALSNRSSKPVVYAAVFTCNKNDDGTYGKWYMVGDKYIGTASIVGYEGEERTGSFDTGTWRSTGTTTYTVNGNYSYIVYAGNTIQNVTQTTDANANREFASLMVKARQILDNKSYAGAAVVDLQATYSEALQLCTVDDSGVVTVNSGTKRSRLVPFIKNLTNLLTPFESP